MPVSFRRYSDDHPCTSQWFNDEKQIVGFYTDAGTNDRAPFLAVVG
jgi:hypothetical protein